MDFSTMRTKLQAGEYHTWEEVQADLDLIFDNALLYTPQPNNPVHIAAKEIKDVARQLLDQAKTTKGPGRPPGSGRGAGGAGPAAGAAPGRGRGRGRPPANAAAAAEDKEAAANVPTPLTAGQAQVADARRGRPAK